MEGKNYKEVRDDIEKALFAGDAKEIADINRKLMEENEWLKSNEGLKKLIEALEDK